jgi:hypothetical protein
MVLDVNFEIQKVINTVKPFECLEMDIKMVLDS